MAKKRGKPVSFDGMVKFFMRHYSIPTRKDIVKIESKLDRIEKLIKKLALLNDKGKANSGVNAGRKQPEDGANMMTATDIVLEIVKSNNNGIDFSGIQSKTGFNDKKLRNIIFRLNKIGRIKRKSRGLYVLA